MTGEIRVADASTWDDVAAVMGPKGAYGGCWCTFWLLTNQEIHGRTPEDNRGLLETLVNSGEPIGLVAYLDGNPVGWCQVAPRTKFPRLFHTRGQIWSAVSTWFARRPGFRPGVLARESGPFALHLDDRAFLRRNTAVAATLANRLG